MIIHSECVVIVTGAAGGQGFAEAERFAQAGASVVATDLFAGTDPDPDAVAAALGPASMALTQDVSDGADWTRVVDHVLDRHGRVDVLVNNAGIHWKRSLLEEDPAQVRRMLEVNLLGAFLGIQAVAPAMISAGRGSIVNVSSIAGVVAFPDRVAYSMAKWGLRGLTRSAALELGPSGIRVNCVLPGAVATPMLASRQATGASAGRISPPEEIASVVHFLASDAAAAITGVDLVADNGYVVGQGRSLLPGGVTPIEEPAR